MKAALERAESEANEVSRNNGKNTGFWAFEKEWEGVCNGRPELLSRRTNADYSGKNS